jgi:hypothetical protein
LVDQTIADFRLVAQHTARANDRITVEPRDLPITRDCKRAFTLLKRLIWMSVSGAYWKKLFLNRRSICPAARKRRLDYRLLRAG